MNLSFWKKKKIRTPLVSVFLLTIPCWPGTRLRAQSTDAPVIGAPALRERMQKTLSRQADSVAAMQRSVTAQQRTAQRQNGEVAEGGFFTLPAPAPMPPAWLQAPATDAGNEDAEEVADPADSKEGAGQQKSPAETETSARVQIPWKSPLPMPASIAAPTGIAGIGGVSEFGDDLGAARPLNLEGILLRQFAGANPAPPPVPDKNDKDSSSGSNTSPRSAGVIDYLRQMLGFSIEGSLLQGLSGSP